MSSRWLRARRAQGKALLSDLWRSLWLWTLGRLVGPIVATVPAGLVALTKSPMLMVWVIVVHAVVETLESHLLTPVTQRYFVDVPSLMTIASFIVFGATMGLGGVLIATPASAAIIVLVRDLYLEERPPSGAL